jgi:hypothetical protein
MLRSQRVKPRLPPRRIERQGFVEQTAHADQVGSGEGHDRWSAMRVCKLLHMAVELSMAEHDMGSGNHCAAQIFFQILSGLTLQPCLYR